MERLKNYLGIVREMNRPEFGLSLVSLISEVNVRNKVYRITSRPFHFVEEAFGEVSKSKNLISAFSKSSSTMEWRALKKCKHLFKWQHLIILRDTEF